MTAAEFFVDAVVTTWRPLATAIGIAELPTNELPPKLVLPGPWAVRRCKAREARGSLTSTSTMARAKDSESGRGATVMSGRTGSS